MKKTKQNNKKKKLVTLTNRQLCISFVWRTFTICTSPTIHFVCLCYLISLGYYSHTQEKLKFWGESKVYYVRFADGEFMA